MCFPYYPELPFLCLLIHNWGYLSLANFLTGGSIDALCVTLCELNPGDKVLTVSDGLTDAFAIINGGVRNLDSHALLSFMRLCEGDSDQILAKKLAEKSREITDKQDDITVCVHTVAFDSASASVSK